jgi:flagellin
MGLASYNVTMLSLLNRINQLSQAQALSLARLSSGSRINKASDDPAGLIALQQLDAERTAVTAAIDNAQRADAMMTVAEGAMGEISDLLLEIESLAVESTSTGGLTQAEIAANQAEIDQAVQSIDHIVRTTSFNGQRLLDGSLSIRTTVSTGSDNVSDVHVHSRPSSQTSSALYVAVTTAAAKAVVEEYATTSAAQATTISITGALGTATIEITAGQNLSAVAAAINVVSSETGVAASATTNNSALHLASLEYGSDAFVIVQNLSGDDTNFADQSQVSGTDAVVTVNGQTATTSGLEVYHSANGLSATFNLTETGNQAGRTAAIDIQGGGATYQLGTDATGRTTIGVDAPLSHLLGSSDLGYLSSLKTGGANSLSTDANAAVAIARQAVGQVATARARIGAFQSYQVDTAVNSLTATSEGLSSARSLIADVDYAAETAALNRHSILLQSALALFGLVNQQASQVLSFLT